MAELFLQALGSDKAVVKEDEDGEGAKGSPSALVCRDLQISHMAPGRLLCRLPAVLPRTVNRFGTLHGGAVATLVNVIGSAAIKTLAGTREGVVTDTNISYLSGAPINDELEIEAKVLKFGRTIAIASVDFRSKLSGRKTAQGRVTMFIGELSKL